MQDIRELREEILTLQSQLESTDLQYRLAEMYDRLGDFLPAPPADVERKGVKRAADPPPVHLVPDHRRG